MTADGRDGSSSDTCRFIIGLYCPRPAGACPPPAGGAAPRPPRCSTATAGRCRRRAGSTSWRSGRSGRGCCRRGGRLEHGHRQRLHPLPIFRIHLFRLRPASLPAAGCAWRRTRPPTGSPLADMTELRPAARSPSSMYSHGQNGLKFVVGLSVKSSLLINGSVRYIRIFCDGDMGPDVAVAHPVLDDSSPRRWRGCFRADTTPA